jgi:hypothetical protein
MSLFSNHPTEAEYWIGKGIDYDAVWAAYESGTAYKEKFRKMQVHLLRITIEAHPLDQPLFNFEAVSKTVKGYFHDLKRMCLSEAEYNASGPLFVYRVGRSSGVWDFLGELRQLLMLGTSLADEKVIGEKLDNLDKRLDFLRKHFGSAVSPQDFETFMRAQTPRQLEKAVRKLIEQGIKKVEVSRDPFAGHIQQPEAPDKPHVLASLSKSFNATAVGLAIEDGKLSLDDPVLKFFPEDAPADPSDNLKAMTVRDLLTMTCGHDTEPKAVGGAPSVKQFLAHPVLHKPGTHFQYNTMGSYTLSAIVTKVTGQTTLEFLKPRLFAPWESSIPSGHAVPKVIHLAVMALSSALKTSPSSASFTFKKESGMASN